MEKFRSAFKILAGKPTGKGPTPMRRLEENIRIYLKKWVSIREIVLMQPRKGIIGKPL